MLVLHRMFAYLAVTIYPLGPGYSNTPVQGIFPSKSSGMPTVLVIFRLNIPAVSVLTSKFLAPVRLFSGYQKISLTVLLLGQNIVIDDLVLLSSHAA